MNNQTIQYYNVIFDNLFGDLTIIVIEKSKTLKDLFDQYLKEKKNQIY